MTAQQYPSAAYPGPAGGGSEGFLQPAASAYLVDSASQQMVFQQPRATEPFVVSKSIGGLTYQFIHLSPMLRRAQISLYVVSFLQFFVAGASTCEFVAYVSDTNRFPSPDSALLAIEAFLFGCAVVGLLAASGRSRVVSGALIVISLLAMTQSCILANFFNKNCTIVKHDYDDIYWKCRNGDYSSKYTVSRYRTHIAKLSVNIILTLGSSISASVLLTASLKTNDVRP